MLELRGHPADGWGNRVPEGREPRVRRQGGSPGENGFPRRRAGEGHRLGGLPTPSPQPRRSVPWAGQGSRVPTLPIASPTRLTFPCASLGGGSAPAPCLPHLRGGSGRPAGEVAWLPAGLQLRVPGEVPPKQCGSQDCWLPSLRASLQPRRPDPRPQSSCSGAWLPGWEAERAPMHAGARGVPACRLAGQGRGGL